MDTNRDFDADRYIRRIDQMIRITGAVAAALVAGLVF